MVGNIRTLKKKCFICNEIRTVNNEAFNGGGLVRVTRKDITDQIEINFFQVSKRIDFIKW